MIQRKPGERIHLISMTDDPDPIPTGATGTVTGLYPQNGWAQVDLKWDNGQSLMLTIPPDVVERIEPPKDAPSC